MPRFVLLHHEFSDDDPRPSHWDWMLERDGQLWTWTLDRLPDFQADFIMTAERLTDHRLAYLDYEGPISGGRGSVQACWRGTCDWLETQASGTLVVRLGEPVCGVLTLERLTPNIPTWRLTWTPNSK